jgi:hypothetical protein
MCLIKKDGVEYDIRHLKSSAFDFCLFYVKILNRDYKVDITDEEYIVFNLCQN